MAARPAGGAAGGRQPRPGGGRRAERPRATSVARARTARIPHRDGGQGRSQRNMTRDDVGPRMAAAAVHAYTACGSVLAFLIVLAAFEGEPVRALWLGLLALIVDGTDGMLARKLQVKERLPWFDGARLDDIVDYLTYAFAPMVLLWTGHYLPSGALATASRSSPWSPRATSSAGPTRRPTTTSSSASPATGTWWRSTRRPAPGTGRPRRPARGAVRPRVRADPVPVPVTDPRPRGVNLLLTAGWLACYAYPAADAASQPCGRRDVAGVRRVLRVPQRLADGPRACVPPISRAARDGRGRAGRHRRPSMTAACRPASSPRPVRRTPTCGGGAGP